MCKHYTKMHLPIVLFCDMKMHCSQTTICCEFHKHLSIPGMMCVSVHLSKLHEHAYHYCLVVVRRIAYKQTMGMLL